MSDTNTSNLDIAATTAPMDELPALQSLIERHASRADQLREEMKAHNESLHSILENDPELGEAEQAAKNSTEKAKTRKKTLTQTPEFRAHQTKVAELKDELKEVEETLNSHLISYFQKTGIKAVDTSDGGQREFRLTAKLLPRKSNKGE